MYTTLSLQKQEVIDLTAAPRMQHRYNIYVSAAHRLQVIHLVSVVLITGKLATIAGILIRRSRLFNLKLRLLLLSLFWIHKCLCVQRQNPSGVQPKCVESWSREGRLATISSSSGERLLH